MKTLEGKTFVTKTNNWYAPTCEFQEKYGSVKRVVLMDTTSSSGDWSGFIIQATGRRSAMAIPFHQENNYPGDGFTLRTGTAFMKGPLSAEFVEIAQEDYGFRASEGYWG